jgi:tetratricopeptide (TPR) repeat protein
MTFITDVLGILAFRGHALRLQARRQVLGRSLLFFAAGFLAFVIVRNSVYADLPEIAVSRQAGLIYSFLHLNLIQAALFLLFVYIPAVVILGNSISGNGLGAFVSRQEYLEHTSVLLPLWGLLLLITAPVQWFLPQFLVIGIFGITVGMLALVILTVVYTVWAVKELNYLSLAQALGVFALSGFTLPIFYLLTSFLAALPLFILIPSGYMGYRWIRSQFASKVNERVFQQHLHALTINPKDADAQYQLGLIHLKRRNLDAAQRYFQGALKIDPDNSDCRYSLGRTYELMGEWPEALEQYEETYRLDPEYGVGDIFREVGKGYLHTGNIEKGMEFLTFFLKKRVSDPEGRFWLAVALKRKGNLEEMRLQLNLILEQARSLPRFFRKKNREWLYLARNMIRNPD